MDEPQKISLEGYKAEGYHPGKNRFVQFLWYFTNVIFFINPLNPISSLKVFLLKIFGAKLGKGVVIKPGVNIKYPWRLTIGSYSWIGEKVWIDNLGDVSIGKHACISQGALLLTGNHNYKRSDFKLIVRNIILEDGVWIGAKSIVAPGTICKSHTVLRANSLVKGTTETYSIYGGNPAVKLKDREINK